jgi:hypothetical protein
MAPMVSNTKKRKDENQVINEILKSEKNNLLQIRKYIEKNFEYVGENFAFEARSIHYDKKKSKGIYGTASDSEMRELQEEGIETEIIPWIKDKNN